MAADYRIKKEFDVTVLEIGLQAFDDKGNPSHTNGGSFIQFQES